MIFALLCKQHWIGCLRSQWAVSILNQMHLLMIPESSVWVRVHLCWSPTAIQGMSFLKTGLVGWSALLSCSAKHQVLVKWHDMAHFQFLHGVCNMLLLHRDSRECSDDLSTCAGWKRKAISLLFWWARLEKLAKGLSCQCFLQHPAFQRSDLSAAPLIWT